MVGTKIVGSAPLLFLFFSFFLSWRGVGSSWTGSPAIKENPR